MTRSRHCILAGVLLLIALVWAGCAARRQGLPLPTDNQGAPGEQQTPKETVFRDVSESAGLRYAWKVNAPRPLNALQTIGNGCAFLDYDQDGNLDILLVGASLALYKGDGKGHFTDVTASLGLDRLHGQFLGCAVGDYDDDGYPDLYISGYRTGLLLHNEKGRRFRDVTASAGLRPQPWGTSAIFFDYDGDGALDLYVCNYLAFGPDTVPQLCEAGPGIKTACGPRWYGAVKGVLYRNLGQGRFRDVTKTSGADNVSGKALGVAAADYNHSGHTSLLLANDEMPGDLLLNTGGHFKNIGPESGTAYDSEGNPRGGMGADWGDYDNDGKLDVFVGTFQNEVKNVYHNEGASFVDRSQEAGMQDSLPYVTFGAKWLDFDNDGFIDLLLTNGHIQDNIERIDSRATYRQPTQLFHNEDGRKFTDVSQRFLSQPARRPIVGRGLAIGDYDNDGRMDALVVDSEGAPILLHNEIPAERSGNWIGITLRQPGRNTFAYGAQVTVKAGGRSFCFQCQPGGSYLSSSDPRIHAGVGKTAHIDRVIVQWPDGVPETWGPLQANRYVVLRRGQGSRSPR
jgi:enediyne biosynthesis protein E4